MTLVLTLIRSPHPQAVREMELKEGELVIGRAQNVLLETTTGLTAGIRDRVTVTTEHRIVNNKAVPIELEIRHGVESFLTDVELERSSRTMRRKYGDFAWRFSVQPGEEALTYELSALDPNGPRQGFFTQQKSGEVQLWDVSSRHRVGRAIVPGAGSVMSLAFDPDGTLLATGSGGRVDLWNVSTQSRHGRTMKVSDDGT